MNNQQITNMVESLIKDTQKEGETECVLYLMIEESGDTDASNGIDQWGAVNRKRLDIAQHVTPLMMSLIQKAKREQDLDQLNSEQLLSGVARNRVLYADLNCATKDAFPSIVDTAIGIKPVHVNQGLLRCGSFNLNEYTELNKVYLHITAWKPEADRIYTQTCINLGHYLAVSLQNGQPDVFAGNW